MAGRLHRKLRNRLTLTCQALALMVAAPAYAARPFVTDDARIVEHCQVETFYKEQRTYSGSEFWLLPACNPFGFEITVGGNRIEGEQNEILQTKFLLKPLAPNDIGFALSLGVFGSDPYFNFITSRSFADDRLVVHGNLGSFRDARHLGTGTGSAAFRVARLRHPGNVRPASRDADLALRHPLLGNPRSLPDRRHARRADRHRQPPVLYRRS